MPRKGWGKMKTAIPFTLAICFCALAVGSATAQSATAAPSNQTPPAAGAPARGRGPQGPGLTLTTTAFPDGGTIPNKYTGADPKPTSPELDWTNVPAGTVTFVLIFHDPDVPLMRKTDDVLHWMAFNIPGTVHQLPEGMDSTAHLPDGTIQAKSVRGTAGYMGPAAPPAGPDHHYTFELFALDVRLDLGPDATRQQVVDAMQGHILGKAVLVGRFHRPPPIATVQ
jgi:Raf kinase inhibitor-like YbhB/YbcL family protein